jgi:hypothetical protein
VAAGVQAEVLATFPADAGGSVSVLGDDQGATVITIDTARKLLTHRSDDTTVRRVPLTP